MSTTLSSSEEELRSRFYSLENRTDIAELLEISDHQLCYHLYIFPHHRAYTVFRIPKKTGEYRLIYSPATSLKIIQKKLNQVLKCVYQPKPSTQGFTTGKSIITNASLHLKQRYILNLDLENFFPSINFGRVRGLFLAHPYNCSGEVATILAQICCYDNQLPQGAPTSPIVSNMICAKMDSQLQRLARDYRCIYTRYADDITFSTARAKFPLQLAWFSDSSGKLNLGNELKEIIKQNGFLLNESKIRFRSKYQHQEVTGVTVNEKLNVKRKYIRQIRAMLHAWEKYGLDNAQAEFLNKFDKKLRFHKRRLSFKYIVKSKIEFVGNVKGYDDTVYLNLLRKLKKLAPELVNNDKLMQAEAKKIQENQKKNLSSVILWTEGKTDIKHLRAALKKLEIDGCTSKFSIEFKDDLDDSKQGSTELLNVCKQYCKNKQSKPMIAIFDRDEPSVVSQVHDESRGFKIWGNGVYSLALPIPEHRQDIKDICIEHYYDDIEIKTKDSKDRRLFLSNEFNGKSCRHLNLNLVTTKTFLKAGQAKIIDNDVFNEIHENVALSKNAFADYVFQGEEKFNHFNFQGFSKVFEVIDKILEFHALHLGSS